MVTILLPQKYKKNGIRRKEEKSDQNLQKVHKDGGIRKAENGSVQKAGKGLRNER